MNRLARILSPRNAHRGSRVTISRDSITSTRDTLRVTVKSTVARVSPMLWNTYRRAPGNKLHPHGIPHAYTRVILSEERILA